MKLVFETVNAKFFRIVDENALRMNQYGGFMPSKAMCNGRV